MYKIVTSEVTLQWIVPNGWHLLKILKFFVQFFKAWEVGSPWKETGSLKVFKSVPKVVKVLEHNLIKRLLLVYCSVTLSQMCINHTCVDMIIIVQFCVTSMVLVNCKCSPWKYFKSAWIWFPERSGNHTSGKYSYWENI